MTEWSKVDWFAFGLIIGLFAFPFARVLTKIIKEVKIAKHEWRNPNRRSDDEHAP
jgi:hypothetical protein